MPITWEAAIVAAQKLINERCAAEGIDPLSGHDLPVLAACMGGEKTYNRIRRLHGDHPDFDREAVQFAAKCIAQAIVGSATAVAKGVI